MQCEIWQLFCRLWSGGGGFVFLFACLHSPLLHCVLAVTLASFCPHDSSGFYFVIFCPAFSFLPPLSLPLSHSSAIPAVCEKKPPQLTGARDTEQHSAFCKHTRSYRRCKKYVNMTRARCKNVLIWYRDVRKTKQDAGSSEWRSAKQQLLLNPCGPQWQGFPPASLSSIRRAKCVTRGVP